MITIEEYNRLSVRITQEEAKVAALMAENERLKDDNIKLLELLAVAYSGIEKLYADDGHLQDASVQPFIDYRNDTVNEISEKMGKRAVATLSSKLADELSPAKADDTHAWETAQEQDCEQEIKEQNDE